jgi:hypothetical protein
VIQSVAGPVDKPVVFLGLTRENTDRMHTDQPIRVRLRELHPDLPDVTVVLHAGETDRDLRRQLQMVSGPPTPPPEPPTPERSQQWKPGKGWTSRG